MKLIVLAPLIALALAGGSAGAYFWLTSEGSVEEATVAQPTAAPTAQTPTAEPAQETPAPAPTQPPGGAGGGSEGTVVPVTPLPSPSPVPDDWATYTDPEGRLALRYPSTWFREGGIIKSWDPGTWDKPWFPPNSTKVDAGYSSVAAADTCGGRQIVDLQTGETVPRPGDTPATLGGVNGWQGITLFDPSTSNGVTRAHAISVIHQGYCFLITAYFTEGSADEATFSQIADSFTFTD